MFSQWASTLLLNPFLIYFQNWKKYKNICEVKNYAITDSCGESEFHYVVSNPAYSGIKKRSYPKDEIIDKIKIKTSTLR